MRCDEAKELIDLRVHVGWASPTSKADRASLSETADTVHDWSDLDAHLAQCPKCKADYGELLRTRTVLSEVADDVPTQKETQTMWSAIQTALPASAVRTPSKRRATWPFLAAAVGAAATLLFALQLGKWHYGTIPKSRMGSPWNTEYMHSVSGRPVGDAPEKVRRFLGLPRDAELADRDMSQPSTPTASVSKVAEGRLRTGRRRETRVTLSPDQVERLHSLGYVAGDVPVYDFVFTRGAEQGEEGFSAGKEIYVGEEFKLTPPPGIAELSETAESVERYPVRDAPAEGLQGVVEESVSVPEKNDVQNEGAGSGARGESAPKTPPVAARPEPAPRPDSKIIKTGELGIEVDDYAAAVEGIYAIVDQHGAFVADGSTQEQAGGALKGRIVIRVAPERFEGLFAALKTVGRIESESVKAADVTAQYVDLEARIHSLQVTEERLRELMKSKSFMDKITSLLEVERELTRVRSQIEQLQGQLRVMADRVAMSTITVTLREPARTVPSASLSVEVPVLADAERALGDALAELGGRLTSGKTAKRDDGTLMGNYGVDITLARFGELLETVEALGRVEQRQVKDRQFSDASAPWADKVKCHVALVLYERSRQLPKGTVKLEIETLPAALEKLDRVLAGCGGAVISNRTTRRDDGSSVADLDLRVPGGRFADLIAGLAPLGRTTAKQVAGEAGRIVGGAADVLCPVSLTLAERVREVPSGSMVLEVTTFESARQQLSTLIAEKDVQVLSSSSQQRTDGTSVGAFRLGIKAGDMERVVSRLESLGRVASRQVTGLGLGDLSKADPNALGVINLTLAEKAALTPEPNRAGGSIRSRFRDGLAGFYASLGLILYGLVVIAPWAVIVLLVGWLVMRRLRRRQAVPAPGTVAGPSDSVPGG